MEILLKGKARYSSPPCTDWFRSAAFDIENIIYFFTKPATLTKEVNCTEPYPSVSLPVIISNKCIP